MNYYDYDVSYGGEYSSLPVIYWILMLGIVVFAIMVIWKIFEKAGKPGWRALVPLYNTYTLFEITWGNGLYFLLLFLAIIPIIGSIAVLVVLIVTYVKLARAFGKSDGFAVGLIFLSFIFMAILAFDSSTYLGVAKKEEDGDYNREPNPMPNNFNNNASQTTAYCHNCGTPLSSDNAYCPNCGTPKAN